MHLSPRVSKLLRAFRRTESNDRRGPQFKNVALALEKEMRAPGVSTDVVIQCFGPPDLWDTEGDREFLVYFFDHEVPGRNADEWYFHLTGEKVTDSGYNQRGINDLSSLKPASEWPQRDA
jgi:hypothetical protein